LSIGIAGLPLSLSVTARAFAATSAKGNPGTSNGLVHTAAAIHQEIELDASPSRVYEALTKTKQFDSITRLSDAAALLNAANAKPTSIEDEVGGAFTLFGGYVTGRNLELLPGERLVQAWRAGSWKAGEYSIAKFIFSQSGAKTRLVFEHRGFPDGEGPSLAKGWHAHYWVPLRKLLAQG
jgi:activator of HSP90 ATPase